MRIGIDLGGTKIAGAVLDRAGHTIVSDRVPTPEAYGDCVQAIVELIGELESQVKARGRLCVGLCTPGTRDPSTGRMTNAYNTPIQGRDLAGDLDEALGPRVRMANDANCFALSEATDGAGAGARSVLGVILGTGVGAGLVIDGRPFTGAHAIAGEWGHNPMPLATAFGDDALTCTCGRRGCIEAYVSGRGLALDHLAATGDKLDAAEICALALEGATQAMESLERWHARVARALATVVNIVDPEVIVFGGGLSAAPGLCEAMRERLSKRAYADALRTRIELNRHGDDSGLRGAAWLWPRDAAPLGTKFVAPLGPSRASS